MATEEEIKIMGAFELAAVVCDEHAKFLKYEADNGGDFKHLMARYEEALHLAKRIRGLAGAVQ